MKRKIVYHVFTDARDEFFRAGVKGEGFKAAEKFFRKWKREKGCARLYEELRDEDGDMTEENCLLTFGPWPF